MPERWKGSASLGASPRSTTTGGWPLRWIAKQKEEEEEEEEKGA